jgi:hypothetical protein
MCAIDVLHVMFHAPRATASVDEREAKRDAARARESGVVMVSSILTVESR